MNISEYNELMKRLQNGTLNPNAARAYSSRMNEFQLANMNQLPQMTVSAPQPVTASSFNRNQPTTSQSLANSNYGSIDDFDYSDPYNDIGGYQPPVNELKNPVVTNPVNELERGQKLENDILQEKLNNMGTSWNDWANIGMGAIGTGMEMSMFGDKKDYLKNSNRALELQTANANEAHQTKMANNASYGSAFGRA